MDSIAPVARTITRWLRSPAVKWIGTGLLSLAGVAFTTGVWPFFKGWVVTRVSEDDLAKLNKRVVAIESSHQVDHEKVEKAGADYTVLNHGERVYWSVQSAQRSKERLYEAFRRIVMLEAEVRTINAGARGAEARKTARSTASNKFKQFVKDGEPYDAAVDKTLVEMGLVNR